MDTAAGHTHRGTEYGARLRHSLCWRKLHPHFTSWPHISHLYDWEIVRPRTYITLGFMSDRKVINRAMKVYYTARKHEERLKQSAYETWLYLPQSHIWAPGLQWQQGLCVLHHHSGNLIPWAKAKSPHDLTYMTGVQGLECTGFKDSNCFLNALSFSLIVAVSLWITLCYA